MCSEIVKDGCMGRRKHDSQGGNLGMRWEVMNVLLRALNSAV